MVLGVIIIVVSLALAVIHQSRRQAVRAVSYAVIALRRLWRLRRGRLLRR